MKRIFQKKIWIPRIQLLKIEEIERERIPEIWLMPVQGIITSSCGKRKNPILKKWEYHNGIDIGVAQNTDAKAVKSGIITEVRYSPTYGNLIKYDTVDGYTILYAHLKKSLVKKGETVQQGQVIAKTGNTGLSTGPHLHYSIWKGEMLMNPMQFVDLPVTCDVRKEYADRGVSFP